MQFFAWVAKALITVAISYAMAMLFRPKTPDAPEPERQDDFPRADEGLGIQHVYGTGWVTLDVVWHGDYGTSAIKQ